MNKILTSLATAGLILSSQSAALADIKPRSVDFGGDGRLGVVAISSNTAETAATAKNYVSLTVNTSITYGVKHKAIIGCTGTLTVNGTLEVVGGFAGGTSSTGRVATSGAGPGGGVAPGSLKKDNDGGGGGGNGGHGGMGGSVTSGLASNNGGRGIGAPDAGFGGGGAAGQADSTGSVGSLGGDGAGSLRVCAKNISIPSGGIIRANGAAGTTAGVNTTGAGGGAGGQIHLYALVSIVNNGAIQATGGNGGNGVGGGNQGGGGGGGGVVLLFAPSTTAGTITLTGGTAGTGGSQMTNGGTGVSVVINAVPTIPLIGCVENSWSDIVAYARSNGGTLTLSQDQIVPFLSSLPEQDNFHNSQEVMPTAAMIRRKYVA